jgi:hypothetical protein
MKLKRFSIILLSSLLFFSFARASTTLGTTQNSSILIQRYTIPVLTHKTTNAVLKIIIKSNNVCDINRIYLTLRGTTNLHDITNLEVYHASEKGNIDLSRQIISTSDIKKNIILPLHLKVAKGDSSILWVSLKLRDKVSLTNRYNVNCKSLELNEQKIYPTTFFRQGLRAGVALRIEGDNGIHTSRIPGLIRTKDGTLIAVYDARYKNSLDLQGDIDICCQRSTDGGKSWGPVIKVLDMGSYGNLPQKYNGVSDASILCNKNTGQIIVAATWMHGVIEKQSGKWVENLNEDSTVWNHQWAKNGTLPGFDLKHSSQLILSKSLDDGITWSKPENITTQVKNPNWSLQTIAPGNGIIMSDGTMVFPAQGRDETGRPYSNIIFSKDNGITWKASNPAWYNTTECAVVERLNGDLMLNIRDNANYKDYSDHNGRRVCISSDMGKTWSEHKTSHKDLIEPVCMGSLYRHTYINKKKSILLFCNPDSKVSRTHITIKSSNDDGETWKGKKILLDELRGAGYSCITSIDKNNIGVLYEGSQCNMVFQVINIKEFM